MVHREKVIKETPSARTAIRQVKREIRILGLAWYAVDEVSMEFTGVVFRGGLWLDGSLRIRARRRPGYVEQDLSQGIRRSAHYGQIRVVMSPLSSLRIKRPFDPDVLVRETGLPLILYGTGTSRVIPYGLSLETALKVVAESRTYSRRPEPLRVAALLARALKGMGLARPSHRDFVESRS